MVTPKTLKIDALSQKSYSSVEWEQLNPVLLMGEFGYDTDKDDFKIGDGVTSWSDLPYFKDEVNIKAEVVLEDPAIGRVRCLSYGTNDLDGVECTVVNDDDQYEKMNLLEALLFNIVGLFYPESMYGFPFGYDGDFNGVHLVLEGLVNASKVELIGNDKQLLIKAIGYMCNPDFDPNADIEDWDDFKDKNFIDLDNYVAITTYLMSDGSPPIEGYGIPFSIIPELIFSLPLSGGSGGGYGDAGKGKQLINEALLMIEDDLQIKVKYSYTGVDPNDITITVDQTTLPFWLFLFMNSFGEQVAIENATYSPNIDLSELDFTTKKFTIIAEGVEYELDEFMGMNFHMSSTPYFNVGARVVVTLSNDSFFMPIELLLKNDGVIEDRRGAEIKLGGGGGALSEEQVYLYDYDWQDMGGTYEATKYISGMDYDSMIWYSATTESLDDFADAGIVMIRQGYGEVTFCCKEVPQNQIGVLVRWQ